MRGAGSPNAGGLLQELPSAIGKHPALSCGIWCGHESDTARHNIGKSGFLGRLRELDQGGQYSPEITFFRFTESEIESTIVLIKIGIHALSILLGLVDFK